MLIVWTRRIARLWLLSCLWSPLASAWDAETVIRGLSHKSADAARFTEIKYLESLDRPLRLDGEVRFTPPDGMEKRITEPYEETMTVSAGWLRLQRGERTREVELERHPVAQAFVTAFVSTLAGDVDTLMSHYDITLEGEPRGWTLVLMPKQEKLRDKVTQIRVSGNADLLQSFETLQPNGDRAIMYFSDLPTASMEPAIEQQP